MGDDAMARRGRGVPAPPPALHAELVRPRLLGQLARRFDVPVTVLTAGPGFGKSVLLAQAIRANQADPRGIDAWLSCEPGDGDAARLADAVTAALPVAPGAVRGDPVDRVVDALNRVAPIDVCVVVDDVHEIPCSSPAAALLAEVTDRLPPHGHVVFSGRTTPPMVPGVHHRGCERIEIDGAQLAFTATEVDALARLVGRESASMAGLDRFAGWPSLIRLALSAPPGAAPQFLWEEVVAGLSADERRWLLALATLGWGTADDIAAVAGHDWPPPSPEALAELATRVPHVRQDVDGTFGVHQLWEAAVDRIFPIDARREPRRRALELFQRRGETLRAGWSALRWGDADGLRRAALQLVGETVDALPADTATRWLAEAPEAARSSPEMRLLEIALRHSRHGDDRRLDDIDGVVEELIAGGNRYAVAVALTLAAAVAHGRGDRDRMATNLARVRALPDAEEEPLLRILMGVTEATIASLEGDPARAVAAVEAVHYDELPAPINELVTRVHANMLALCGRAGEAAQVAARLEDSPSAYVRTIPAKMRWLAGEPNAFAGNRVGLEVLNGTNECYHLYHATYAMAVAASFGDRPAIEALRPVIERTGAVDSRDPAHLAFITALRHIADHDEPAAQREMRAYVDQHLDDPVADSRLRRMMAVAYVCDERVRERWGHADLGPSLERQRQVADALLAARAGAIGAHGPLPPAAAVVTTLPLAWSVELAARAVSAGCEAGISLARELAEHASAAVRAELQSAAACPDRAVRDGATRLLDELPDTTRPPAVRIAVLGPLAVDGVAAGQPAALRRRRVRTLVELLVLLGPLRRDRIATLIWPDLDPDAAQSNVRVTLSRLRAALEPMPTERRRCAALRVDQDIVALTPACVDVDWWRFREDVAAADEAERVGDTATAIDALHRACGRWRGDPFADVDPVDDVALAVEEARRLLVETTLRLGEHMLVVGRFDEAAACAERAVRESPYTERAHRLAIAAQLQRRDRHAIAHAMASTRAMLADLGVDAEPATRMLLRQAEARVGDADYHPVAVRAS